jgi:hypothetical protein
MSLLGKWSKVTAADPPMVKNGRIKTAEGQGARVRNISRCEDTGVLEGQIPDRDQRP